MKPHAANNEYHRADDDSLLRQQSHPALYCFSQGLLPIVAPDIIRRFLHRFLQQVVLQRFLQLIWRQHILFQDPVPSLLWQPFVSSLWLITGSGSPPLSSSSTTVFNSCRMACGSWSLSSSNPTSDGRCCRKPIMFLLCILQQWSRELDHFSISLNSVAVALQLEKWEQLGIFRKLKEKIRGEISKARPSFTVEKAMERRKRKVEGRNKRKRGKRGVVQRLSYICFKWIRWGPSTDAKSLFVWRMH